MLLCRLTLDFVIHKCCYIVLKRISKLVNSSLVSTFIDMALKLIVSLQDLLVSVGKIILTAVCA